MKVVVNASYGGFSLTEEGARFLQEKYGIEFPDNSGYEFLGHKTFYSVPLERNDYRLVDCVESLAGPDGRFAGLGIIEVPDNVEWEIEEYDGYEYVVEKHRSWHFKEK